MKNIISLTSVLLLSSCATKYIPPEKSNNTVILNVIHTSDYQNSLTRVNGYDNQNCNFTEGFGRLATLGEKLFTPKKTNVRIKSNKQIFLTLSGSGNIDVNASYYRKYSCSKFISFVPEANVEYELSLSNPELPTCSVELKSKTSNEKVKFFKYKEFPKSCSDVYVY